MEKLNDLSGGTQPRDKARIRTLVSWSRLLNIILISRQPQSVCPSACLSPPLRKFLHFATKQHGILVISLLFSCVLISDICVFGIYISKGIIIGYETEVKGFLLKTLICYPGETFAESKATLCCFKDVSDTSSVGALLPMKGDCWELSSGQMSYY